MVNLKKRNKMEPRYNYAFLIKIVQISEKKQYHLYLKIIKSIDSLLFTYN